MSKYLSLFSFSLIFFLWFVETAKSTRQQVFFLFIFLSITRSCLLTRIRGSVFISESQRILCVLFSRVDSDLCIYRLVVWSNFNFLHNSHLSHPIESSLVFLVLVYCIHLLCDYSFRLHHHITYTCLSFVCLGFFFFVFIYIQFNIGGPYGVILCCHQKRFSFSLTVSLSLACLGLFHVRFR